MKLSTLRKMIQIRKIDDLTYEGNRAQRSAVGFRKCHRINTSEAMWLLVNGSLYTARQVSERLGHAPNTIRSYARRNGIQLKHK